MTTTTEKDVIELLVEQHNEIKSLFEQLRVEQGGDKKRELFEDLVRLLVVHETAEEEVVHPRARARIDHGHEVVDQRLQEEDEAKHVLAELYDLGVGHPEFDSKLAEFEKSVVEHATHEEEDEFRSLRDTLSSSELRGMAGVMRVAEATAPTRPHPSAGESATANLLAGPPLAMFDRLRDAVRDWRQSHERR